MKELMKMAFFPLGLLLEDSTGPVTVSLNLKVRELSLTNAL